MAPQPTRDSARTVLTTAGLGVAAVMLATAAAAPALADGDGNNGANGNHYAYGQRTDHGNNGQGPSNSRSDNGSNGQSSPDSGASSSDPAGNNGTVFIHDVPNDQNPHNVPHVGCTFYVDFFGFDAGQKVTVSFAGQAPTGKDTPLGGGQTIDPVSDDSAGGAGNDWDYEITVTAADLGVSALGDPAHEGYHIKMSVETYAPGDHKYKVFWMQPCEQPQSTTTESGTTTNTDVGAVSVGQQLAAVGTTTGGNTSAGASAGQTSPTSKIPTVVLGRSITRNGPTPGAAPSAGSLPFTGAQIGGLAGAAALLLGGGTALTVVGRRRRRA
jgi:hypothetical protein